MSSASRASATTKGRNRATQIRISGDVPHEGNGDRVSGTALEELMLGAGEAIGDARRHGGPPVTARIWAGPGRILVHVHDTGPGPADPLAGLVPVLAGPGLRAGGLWLIHMLGLDTALIRSRDGFTVRLAAGHAA